MSFGVGEEFFISYSCSLGHCMLVKDVTEGNRGSGLETNGVPDDEQTRQQEEG